MPDGVVTNRNHPAFGGFYSLCSSAPPTLKLRRVNATPRCLPGKLRDSSVVERHAVNVDVPGSNPGLGA